MPDLTPKRAGYCSVCDNPIIEMDSRYVDGKESKFGKIKPGSKRTTLVLYGGSLMDWSLCAKCDLTPENVPLTWRRMLMALALETNPIWREGKGLKPYTEQQRRAKDEQIKRTLVNVPMGILFTMPLEEAINGG